MAVFQGGDPIKTHLLNDLSAHIPGNNNNNTTTVMVISEITFNEYYNFMRLPIPRTRIKYSCNRYDLI